MKTKTKQNGYAFKVEKRVKMPKSMTGTSGGRRHSKYPFAAMEKGDSFAVPLRKEKSLRALAAIQRLKFACRKQGNEVRCWRVA